MPDARWGNEDNAVRYDQFARTFPMYRETSRDVVARAGIQDGDRVLDLACGTGVTTEELLERIGGRGAVVALDGSAAMLDLARRRVEDPRVSWVLSLAEDLETAVGGEIDAAVCNSAIWQTDMPVTLAAIRHKLRRGGRFAFNVGEQFILRVGPAAEPRKPSLTELAVAIAVLEHDFVPPHRMGRLRPLTIEGIGTMLREAGFSEVDTETIQYTSSPESHLAWLSIPVFTELPLAGLDYETRMLVVNQAYERWDKQVRPLSWIIFTAIA